MDRREEAALGSGTRTSGTVLLERQKNLTEMLIKGHFTTRRRRRESQVSVSERRPLGPLGFDSPKIAQRHALHVERTAKKAVMLSDRV